MPLSNVTAITIFDGKIHVFMKNNTLSSGKITIVILPEKSIPLFHKSMNFPLARRYIRMLFFNKNKITIDEKALKSLHSMRAFYLTAIFPEKKHVTLL
jgi:hypothetical protein